MEPLSVILCALVAGAAAVGKNLAGETIKDAYAYLKGLLLRRFGRKTKIEGALDMVESDVDSRPSQDVLREELEKGSVGEDKEVLKAAADLIELLNEKGLIDPSHKAILEVDGAIAQGTGATATGKGGVIIGGDVKGTIVTGNGNTVQTRDNNSDREE